jgi:hypothetical protein
MTVDGRPAMSVDLTVKDEESGCPNHGMALWRDGASPSTGQGIWINDVGWVQLVVFDVEEATIAIEIWSPDSMRDWLPRAHAIVESMQFIGRPADEHPSSPSPATP